MTSTRSEKLPRHRQVLLTTNLSNRSFSIISTSTHEVEYAKFPAPDPFRSDISQPLDAYQWKPCPGWSSCHYYGQSRSTRTRPTISHSRWLLQPEQPSWSEREIGIMMANAQAMSRYNIQQTVLPQVLATNKYNAMLCNFSRRDSGITLFNDFDVLAASWRMRIRDKLRKGA